MVDEWIGKCRTDGVYKLPYAKYYLYPLFLWLWVRQLQQAKVLRALFCGGSGMDLPVNIFRNMVALFPIRTV